MSNTNTNTNTNTSIDERVSELERAMRQEDPALVATFERLGLFESGDQASRRRLLLIASVFVFVVAIATMSPVAWVLSALAVYAWRRS